ncbi:MAG: hypothetical protein V3U49_01370 [Nitrososphaerales archaeon]
MRPHIRKRKLDLTLDHLKQRFEIGYNLKVSWVPRPHSDLDGEVKGSTIFIYSADLESAKATLKHEFVEYLIHSHTKELQTVINDQRDLINRLFADRQKRAYEAREMIVERIVSGLEGI